MEFQLECKMHSLHCDGQVNPISLYFSSLNMGYCIYEPSWLDKNYKEKYFLNGNAVLNVCGGSHIPYDLGKSERAVGDFIDDRVLCYGKVENGKLNITVRDGLIFKNLYGLIKDNIIEKASKLSFSLEIEDDSFSNKEYFEEGQFFPVKWGSVNVGFY